MRLMQRQMGGSWQITPRVLTEALAAGGEEAKRAFDAMMGMRKIDVAAIKAARRGWRSTQPLLALVGPTGCGVGMSACG